MEIVYVLNDGRTIRVPSEQVNFTYQIWDVSCNVVRDDTLE